MSLPLQHENCQRVEINCYVFMKTFQKFLQYSRKLEELQTARKAKEVDEIRKFEVQQEARKQHNLERHVKTGDMQAQSQHGELEHPLLSEQEWKTLQIQHLSEVTEFDQYAQQIKSAASNNEVEEMIALQENMTGASPDVSQALPSVTHELFGEEVIDVTEHEFQRELQHNHDVIHANQAQEERKPHSQAAPENPEPATSQRPSLEDGLTLDDDEPLQEEGDVETRQETQSPAAGNLFYFRKPYTSSDFRRDVN